MIQYSRSPQDQFKSEDYTIGWSWRLFIFSIIVFAAAALLYLGMTVGYLPTLGSQIDEVQKKTDDINNSISAADKERLFNFYSQVFHIQDLLQGHLVSSRLLGFLEQNTNKNVFYNSMSFSADTALIELSGGAASYGDLVGQLEAFRRQSAVTSVLLAGSKNNGATLQGQQGQGVVNQDASKGAVGFTIKLSFDKKFLKP